MRSYATTLVAALLFAFALAYCSGANVVFTVTVSSQFTLPCSSVNPTYYPGPSYPPWWQTIYECDLTDGNYPAGPPNPGFNAKSGIQWGQPAVGGTVLRSGLTFVATPGSLTIQNGLQYTVNVGALTHFNYKINCPNGHTCENVIPTNFGWDLHMQITSPVLFGFTGSYNIFLNETANQDLRTGASPFPPCPWQTDTAGKASWIEFNNGGYTSNLPCCAFYTVPQNPSGIGGFCADYIDFQDYYTSETIQVGNDLYTVVLVGFSNNINVPPNPQTEITAFISQEQNQSVGYVWASIVKKCYQASSCIPTPAQSCQIYTCNANGDCVTTNQAGGITCTDPGPNEAPYDAANTCLADFCSPQSNPSNNDGTCHAWAVNNGVSCNTAPAPDPNNSPDCIYAICNSGACNWHPKNSGTTCSQLSPGFALHDPNCQAKQCDSNGNCKPVLINGGNACTPQGTKSQTAITNGCNTAKCSTNGGFSQGTCSLKVANNGASCASAPSVVCANQVCFTKSLAGTSLSIGSCHNTQFNYPSNAGSCKTGLSVVGCQKRICVSQSKPSHGTCGYASDGSTGSCKNAGLPPASACNIRACKGGSCIYSSFNTVGGGTCTKTNPNNGPQQCKTRICKTVGGSRRGTCAYQNFSPSGTCTNGIGAQPWCNTRVCSNGNCIYQFKGGSCKDIPAAAAKSCKVRGCSSNNPPPNKLGTCKYVSDGSAGTCNTVTAGQCTAAICNNGNCGLTISSNIGNGDTCSDGKAAIQCKKRNCVAFGGGKTGSCGFVSDGSSGSCKLRLPTIYSCNLRQCSAGSCIYVVGARAPGSCTSIAGATPCKTRVCAAIGGKVYAGTCAYNNANSGGSCTGVGASKICNKRLCSGGACTYQYQAGSCKSLGVGKVCSDRLCFAKGASGSCHYAATASRTQSGSCKASGYGDSLPPAANGECSPRFCNGNNCQYSATAGSCKNSRAAVICKSRLCNGQTGVTAACVISNQGFTGSCKTGPLPSLTCNKRLCDGAGNCAYTVANGQSCTTVPPYSTNDATCWAYNCATKAGVGTCTVAINQGNTCTGVGYQLCHSRSCNAVGACVSKVSPSGSICSGTGATTCSPTQCDTSGNCNAQPLNSGSCSSVPIPDQLAAKCIVQGCRNGQCVDLSPYSTYENTFVCNSDDGFGIDHCSHFVCHYRTPSNPSNRGGTCTFVVDNAKISASCPNPNPQADPPQDQLCFNFFCNGGGACTKKNANDGIFCATPSSTPVNDFGYGCSQYQCLSGTCNEALVVPIGSGQPCTGYVPCDPSQPTCNSECSKFICQSGQCNLVNYHNNQVCQYPKSLTAKRATSGSSTTCPPDTGGGVARATTSGSCTPNNDDAACSIPVCTAGVCLPSLVKNGTLCGSALTNKCFLDYCDASGYCVHKGPKDCSGEVTPNVCSSPVCNRTTGDCEIQANGVVDCSCISDCSVCTATNLVAASDTSGRSIACYWCKGAGSNPASCHNRLVPNPDGTVTTVAAPTDDGECSKTDSICSGGGGLSAGAIAGIIIGILALTGSALLAFAAAVLLARFFSSGGTPPADANLQNLSFSSDVQTSAFYQPAMQQNYSAAYAGGQFVTN